MSILGIDLGTGSVKAAVVDDGRVLAKRSRRYDVRAPRPGWAEIDAESWLAATQDAAREVLDDPAAGNAVEAVGFSGQMHGVVLTDANLRPLRPAIIWADTRSVAQAEEMAVVLGPATLSRLGSPAVTGFAATTLAWLLENEPGVVAKAAHVLQPKDWLRARLGGAVLTDPSDASGTLLCDVRTGTWSAEVVAQWGVDRALLPRIASSFERAGEIVIGGQEIRAVVGGADTACALAGLGLRPGDGFVAVGSGAQIVSVMDSPILDPSLRTHTFATAGAPGSGWYRIGAVQSAGLVLGPTLAMLDATVDEANAALTAGVQPDDPVFVPYLAGERTPFMDPLMRGWWWGLSIGTDREALLRSVVEGVAQAVALGVAAVQESGASLPDQVPLVGGGTYDPAFRQLLADATGLSLAVTEAPDAAVVGAALLAEGRSENPHPPARVTVVEPRPEAAELLEERRTTMVRVATTREDS